MSEDFNSFILGNQKLKKNDLDGAMYHFHSCLKVKKNNAELYLKNFELFCKNKITKKNFQLLKTICEFYFEDNLIHHQLGSEKAIRLTKFYQLKIPSKITIFNRINLEIIDDNLLKLILKKCLIADLDLEIYLTKLRKELLKTFLLKKKNDFFLKIYFFLVAFAEQCFLNEFIYNEDDEEKKLLSNLEKKIKKKRKICEVSLLLLSLYKPIYRIDYLNCKLNNYFSSSMEFNDFLKFVFNDPKYEKEIVKSIKSISNFSNKTSKLIKKQYEENPYPRWRYTENVISEIDLNDFAKKITKNDFYENFFKKPKILIAGSGTGHQVVQWSAIKDSEIFAVDLSKVSLAYSIRKTKEMDIKNVNHYNLDLLDLKLLDNKFDIIICTGCLHHMESPEDGLDSLLNFLKPDGLLKLGLYSRHARSEIKWAKEYIKKKKISVTEENIKNFRSKIFTSKNKNFQFIRKSNDFFSLSNFRDLIFNYKEHCFDLFHIKKLLKSRKLKFLDFVGLPPHVLNEFSTLNPDLNEKSRLELWNKYELTYPKTFLGMYQFWVKKNSCMN